MNIEVLALCDAAVESNGRLTLVGTIDYFWTARMPFTYPKCVAALRVRFDGFEHGHHLITMSLVDADANPVLPSAEFEIEVPRGQTHVPILRHLFWPLEDLTFDHFGEYAIEVRHEGRHCAMLPIPILSPKQISSSTLIPS